MDEVERLKERIVTLERKLESLHAVSCPLCNGTTTRSTLYPKRFCAQDFGLCGQLVVSKEQRRKDKGESFCFFRRTTIDNGKGVEVIEANYGVALHWFFVGGKQVTKEEYAQS